MYPLGRWRMWSHMKPISSGTTQNRMKPRINIESSIADAQNITDCKSYCMLKLLIDCLTRNISLFIAKSRCDNVLATCFIVGFNEFAA